MILQQNGVAAFDLMHPRNKTLFCVSYFQTHDDFKVDIMDMRDMSDIGSLFGTGKDEQRTSPEEPGWCNTYRGPL